MKTEPQSFLSQIQITQILGPLDYVFFFLVLGVTFSSIIYGHLKKKRMLDQTKEKNREAANYLDLVLMGRQLTLPLFVATLVATWYGGIFGVTEIAFNYGIYNFITQGFFWYVAYLIFAFFLVNKIAPYKAVTLPHLIGKMFGPKAAYLSAIFNFINVLPIAYIISLGFFLQIIWGGTLLLNMLLGIFVVTLYSLLGGFRAVVFSDLVQFFVMCSGVFLGLLFAVLTFGGPGFLFASLPPTHFSLTGGQGIAITLVWGFIALSTLVDPNFYQRCFAAESPKVAKRGIIISTAIWFCFDICTTLGAMYARAVIPEASSGQAYLIFMLQLLPEGLRGFFLAGILATIISTLDSYIFMAGTTLSHDLMPKSKRGKPFFFYVGVILVGILGLLMALIFDGNIKDVWKTLGSYSAACLLFPVVIGHLYPRKFSDNAFVSSCLLSALAVTFARQYQFSIDPLYIGLAVSSLSLFVFGVFLSSKDDKDDAAHNT